MTSVRSALLIVLLQVSLLALPVPVAHAEPLKHTESLKHTEPLKIATTIRPLTLLVQDLVQGLPVEVTTLLPANADPHNWAMRISDRRALAEADLVVWLGPDFERFLSKPLTGLDTSAQVMLGELPDLQWPTAEQESHSEHHEGRDMHIWLNPANAAVIQTAVAERLSQLRPDWAEQLQSRLHQQLTALNDLQQTIATQLAPYRQQGFLAYHDAYGHFVYAFGLRQLGAVNQSSEQRLSAKKLDELKKLARDARCLMVEINAEPEQRLAKTLRLPFRVANGLALERDITRYTEFLRHVAAEFQSCLDAALPVG